MSASRRRTGVFGGTFDPIHRGHLDTAEAARAALQLDEVLLVTTNVAPHRAVHPSASSYHRFAMVALAVADRDGLLASDLELSIAAPSYTVATLDQLARDGYSPSQLFFIAGADAFAEIATWKDYPALLDRSHFAVVSRPGHPVAGLRTAVPALAPRMIDVPVSADPSAVGARAVPPPQLSILLIDARTADVSATRVRQLAAAGTSLASLVAPAVARHIQRHGLYGAPVSAGRDGDRRRERG